MNESEREILQALEDVCSQKLRSKLQRLSFLLSYNAPPKIVVFGKYNHGKSSLLNAIVGEEHFAVSDVRETTSSDYVEYDGSIWVDTPGLDADIEQGDDEKAKAAAANDADILCLVHNVQTGELDQTEKNLFEELARSDAASRRCVLLVLTQIDQLDEDQLKQVTDTIRSQVPGLNIFCVSANRFVRGKRKHSQKLIELSGMPYFLSHLDDIKHGVATQRKEEGRAIVSAIRADLDNQLLEKKRKLDQENQDFREYADSFKNQIDEITEVVARKAASGDTP